MITIVLSACPVGLRGHLTRWLMEISAGVFVGNVSVRVRELLWLRVIELSGSGRALMVYSVPGEQRLSFRVHKHHWEPTDFDGITLMMRPNAGTAGPVKPGWSTASKRRRYGGQRPPGPSAPAAE
ncbi:MAG: type I-E CRISPR-associated endoribonuclease Cas2e [Actinomycetota bacterium]|nr:type I-E CRISPR-associated endoribonuclease Cas2e [Actinomycetota bacterium]